MSAPSAQPSFLSTSRGKLTLALLCSVALLDFIDAAIVNVALPTIRHHLHFSVQSLQWVLSGYLLTYGGERGESEQRRSRNEQPASPE